MVLFLIIDIIIVVKKKKHELYSFQLLNAVLLSAWHYCVADLKNFFILPDWISISIEQLRSFSLSLSAPNNHGPVSCRYEFDYFRYFM